MKGQVINQCHLWTSQIKSKLLQKTRGSLVILFMSTDRGSYTHNPIVSTMTALISWLKQTA